MKQTSNVQRSTPMNREQALNAQLGNYSELDVGSWTPARDLSELDVERFPSPNK